MHHLESVSVTMCPVGSVSVSVAGDITGECDPSQCVEAAGRGVGTSLFPFWVIALAWSWLTRTMKWRLSPEHSESGSYWACWPDNLQGPSDTLLHPGLGVDLSHYTLWRPTNQCSRPQPPAAGITHMGQSMSAGDLLSLRKPSVGNPVSL